MAEKEKEVNNAATEEGKEKAAKEKETEIKQQAQTEKEAFPSALHHESELLLSRANAITPIPPCSIPANGARIPSARYFATGAEKEHNFSSSGELNGWQNGVDDWRIFSREGLFDVAQIVLRESTDWVAWHIELSRSAYLAFCMGDESRDPAPLRNVNLYLDPLGTGKTSPDVPAHDQRVTPNSKPFHKFDVIPPKRLYFVCQQIPKGSHIIILELAEGSPFYNSDLGRYQPRNLYIGYLIWFYC